MEVFLRLNPAIQSAGTWGGECKERRFEQFGTWVFCRSLGLNFTEFYCCSVYLMGWEEREFIVHIYSNLDLQVYFFFQHQNQKLEVC